MWWCCCVFNCNGRGVCCARKVACKRSLQGLSTWQKPSWLWWISHIADCTSDSTAVHPTAWELSCWFDEYLPQLSERGHLRAYFGSWVDKQNFFGPIQHIWDLLADIFLCHDQSVNCASWSVGVGALVSVNKEHCCSHYQHVSAHKGIHIDQKLSCKSLL